MYVLGIFTIGKHGGFIYINLKLTFLQLKTDGLEDQDVSFLDGFRTTVLSCFRDGKGLVGWRVHLFWPWTFDSLVFVGVLFC